MPNIKAYSVERPNVKISISHEGGENLEYTSFERFTLYQDSTTKPIKNLTVEYEFLLSTPVQKALEETQEYSSYEIKVVILPTLYENHDMDGLPAGFRKIILSSQPSIVCEITYVDYAVARSFQSAVKEWISTIKTKPDHVVMAHFKKNSTLYFRVIRVIAVAILIAYVFLNIPAYLPSEGFEKFSRWLLLTTLVVFVASATLKLIERAYDSLVFSMQKICLLRINAGDKKNADKIEKLYRGYPKKLVTALLASVLALPLNILIAIITSKLIG